MSDEVRRPKSWKLYGRCDECGVDPGLRCRDMDDRPVNVVCKGRPLAKEPPRVFCAGCRVELAPTGPRLVSPESWCSGACRMRTYSRRDAEAHRAFVSKFKAKRAVDDDEVAHAARRRFLSDREAMERIARVFDDAEQTVGDAIEEIARLVRLTGRTLKHEADDDDEEG